jgi:hypothetical protein
MIEQPTTHLYHWTQNEIVNTVGARIGTPGLLPKTEKGSINNLNIQLVIDGVDGLENYTGLPVTAACNLYVDTDFNNAPAILGLPANQWVNVAGNEWKQYVSTYIPVDVWFDAVAATSGTSGSLAAGEWALDSQYIHIHLYDSSDPTLLADDYITVRRADTSSTEPFITAESDVFNLPGTWYDSVLDTMRDPDITAGELTFETDATLLTYYDRIGIRKYVGATGQIGIYIDGQKVENKLFESQFYCFNAIQPDSEPVFTAPSAYYTKSEADSLFLAKGEGDKKIITVSYDDLTSLEYPWQHDLDTLTPVVEAYTDLGEFVNDFNGVVVDENNVVLDFSGFPEMFEDYTVTIAGGSYTVAESLELGETSITAYRGDRGAEAYDHSQEAGNAHNMDADELPVADAGGYFTATDVEGVEQEIGAALALQQQTTRVTTAYTILVTDKAIYCNTDGGDFTVTLPPGVDGQLFEIYNTGSGILTVAPDGAELIDGVNSSKTMGQGSITLRYETTEGWW